MIAVGERRRNAEDSLVVPGASVWAMGDMVVPRRTAHAIAEGRAVASAATLCRCGKPPAARTRRRASRSPRRGSSTSTTAAWPGEVIWKALIVRAPVSASLTHEFSASMLARLGDHPRSRT